MTEDRKYVIRLSSKPDGTKGYLDTFVSDIADDGDSVSGSSLLDQALLFTWERANEIVCSEYFRKAVALLSSRVNVKFFPTVVSVDFYKSRRANQ